MRRDHARKTASRRSLGVCLCAVLIVALLAGKSGEAHEPQNASYDVLIFSGHIAEPTKGPDTRGATSFSGTFEYKFNDSIAVLFTIPSNQVQGVVYKVVPATRNIGLKKRVQYANRQKPDLYIEIHHDSAQQSDLDKARSQGLDNGLWNEIRGFSIHYSERSVLRRQSRKFAELLGSEMVERGRPPNLYHADREGMRCTDRKRGLYNRIPPHSLYVLCRIESPSVVFECGTIANPHEEKNLSENETRRTIVEAINQAIRQYFGIEHRLTR